MFYGIHVQFALLNVIICKMKMIGIIYGCIMCISMYAIMQSDICNVNRGHISSSDSQIQSWSISLVLYNPPTSIMMMLLGPCIYTLSNPLVPPGFAHQLSILYIYVMFASTPRRALFQWANFYSYPHTVYYIPNDQLQFMCVFYFSLLDAIATRLNIGISSITCPSYSINVEKL